ncbi:DUF1501 domain-containing protein [Tautonia plasticadhaerens]|uniref:DUF1501 domain-containing protein n=1 Tax=Tautonia plasticadhaerens TaxID=2527974 RepID=A0A518HEL0_9BACT|nr:DUF1501 domain-containing protein [Tautonia plasticadhaerens]QDV39196.1 hypothetical protein ElP_71600 [Tautonia plasticadhaerens]
MPTPSRRDFLRAGLRSSSLIALAPMVPGFLARSARAARPEADARVLVVIQLDGGNDGINTVVPFEDDGYARHRDALRLPADRLIKIDDRLALHPSMRGAADLLESGRLAIVPGVGYPNPNRSHFESMAIWHSARLDPEDRTGQGWLGRAFDESGLDGSPSLLVGPGPSPTALIGRRASAASLERLDDYAPAPLVAGLGAAASPAPAPGDDLAAFVRRSTLDAYATADQLAELAREGDDARYPATGLADRLRTVARLLKAGHAARAYYATQPGYDTHAGQLPTHGRLLSELSGALKAFLDDLAAAGLAERVLVLCFSEFGRRVAENGSAGTDHGTAGPVLVAGPGVAAGVAGPSPSLEELEGGDLATAVDFRRVYATVLSGWMGLPAGAALGGEFEPLPLLGG